MTCTVFGSVGTPEVGGGALSVLAVGIASQEQFEMSVVNFSVYDRLPSKLPDGVSVGT